MKSEEIVNLRGYTLIGYKEEGSTDLIKVEVTNGTEVLKTIKRTAKLDNDGVMDKINGFFEDFVANGQN